MQRRQFHQTSLIGALLCATYQHAWALSLGDISNADAGRGVKAALAQGAQAAVALLGRPDGFLGNPKVRIGLPGYLEDAAKVMKSMGQGKRIDELVTSINRAAEAAVPLGKDILVQAVQSMSVTDAKNILTGGDTSVTEFFVTKTRAPLSERFLPVVNKAQKTWASPRSTTPLPARRPALACSSPKKATWQATSRARRSTACSS